MIDNWIIIPKIELDIKPRKICCDCIRVEKA